MNTSGMGALVISVYKNTEQCGAVQCGAVTKKIFSWFLGDILGPETPNLHDPYIQYYYMIWLKELRGIYSVFTRFVPHPQIVPHCGTI